MISIRGGSGLGDSLYMQAIARHLAGQGHRVEACSNWPDVFRPLVATGAVTVSPFRRHPIDRLAHYARRRGVLGTTQFEDCCRTAGIPGRVELRLDWTVEDTALAAQLRRRDPPAVAVQLPRAPMGRTDGFGRELLPDCAVLQRIIDRLRQAATIVQIGAGEALYRFERLDLDLANRTTVSQLLDVAATVDGFFGYPSFVIPLAESLGKPALIVWSRKGLNSPREVVRQMTPAKLLHGPLSRHLVDDCPGTTIEAEADAFMTAINGCIFDVQDCRRYLG